MIKQTKLFDLIIGLLMTVTGVYIWFHPLDTLIIVALYLGMIFLLIGVIYIIEFFTRKHNRYLIYGLIDAGLGIILISNGSLVAKTLAVILGIWILFSSILQISTSINFKKMRLSFWIYPLIIGVLGVIFSLIILINPSAGVLTIAIIIGTYMILYGLTMIFEYFLLKDLNK